jgi:hypothetical protein
MRRHLFCATAFLSLIGAAACGGNGGTGMGGGGNTGNSTTTTGSDTTTSASNGGGGNTTTTTGSGGMSTWTVVDLVDETLPDTTVIHYKDTAVVSGIWFKDTSHGVVSVYGGNKDGFTAGGAIEHLASATKVDKIALSGNAAFGGQDGDFFTFFSTPLGLIAASNFGDSIVVSNDDGATFKIGPASTSGTPNAQQVWLSKDSKGAWHELDDIGNVWLSSSDPGPSSTWTRTWNPEAVPPDPNPVPAEDCQQTFFSGYFAKDPQRVFWASSDGQTMVYPRGYGDNPAGVCRSTDGGHNFLPVDLPNPPADSALSAPYVILFTSDTHGIAARSNDLDSLGAYIYTTDDGGATWTAATLPSILTTADQNVAITSGFAAPDGQHVWLVGFQGSNTKALLLKSSDGGKTWKDLSAKLGMMSDTYQKLHTGFALDANNIWVGGDLGQLYYSPTGGE